MVFVVYILIFFVGHKVFASTLNLRITPLGLEVTRVKGFAHFPKHRVIKWEDMKKCYLWGWSRGPDFFIKTRTERNFRIDFPIFTFIKEVKESDKTLFDFRVAFEKAAKDHGVKTESFLNWSLNK